jgi:hypothetical protein
VASETADTPTGISRTTDVTAFRAPLIQGGAGWRFLRGALVGSRQDQRNQPSVEPGWGGSKARLVPSRKEDLNAHRRSHGDDAAVTALLDRLLHHAHVLKCGPRSWRTKVQADLRAKEAFAPPHVLVSVPLQRRSSIKSQRLATADRYPGLAFTLAFSLFTRTSIRCQPVLDTPFGV